MQYVKQVKTSSNIIQWINKNMVYCYFYEDCLHVVYSLFNMLFAKRLTGPSSINKAIKINCRSINM